jgi:hypothetical protein
MYIISRNLLTAVVMNQFERASKAAKEKTEINSHIQLHKQVSQSHVHTTNNAPTQQVVHSPESSELTNNNHPTSLPPGKGSLKKLVKKHKYALTPSRDSTKHNTVTEVIGRVISQQRKVAHESDGNALLSLAGNSGERMLLARDLKRLENTLNALVSNFLGLNLVFVQFLTFCYLLT